MPDKSLVFVIYIWILELILLPGADNPPFCCIGTFIDGEPIIKLPPKTISLTHVDFSVEERAFYRKLEADSRSQFKVPFFICSFFIRLSHILSF